MHTINAKQYNYRQNSNISHTLCNYIVGHSAVVRASPGDAAPTNIVILDLTPSFNGLYKDNCKTKRETFSFWDLVRLILEVWR